MLHSSLMRPQKIDIMHSLLPLHRKRLHCILDVSQISLRLTLLFLYDPILPKFLSYIVSQIILFWKSLSSQVGRRKPPNLLWTWRLDSNHLLFFKEIYAICCGTTKLSSNCLCKKEIVVNISIASCSFTIHFIFNSCAVTFLTICVTPFNISFRPF